jgi:hydrogenase maturation protease
MAAAGEALEGAGRTVVLGLGNLLCTDDGLGVAALHQLRQRYVIPDEILLLDGGTLGLALLPHITGAAGLLILDAVGAAAPPGTLLRFEGDAAGLAMRERLSVHQVGVADLLCAARWLDRYPRRTVLLGVVPESTELGVGCTRTVERQLSALVRAAAQELESFGFGALSERAQAASRSALHEVDPGAAPE